MLPDIKEKIFSITSEEEFNKCALEIFSYQYENNPVYKKFVRLGCRDTKLIRNYKHIPFLPIEFFKSQKVVTGNNDVQTVFGSSGTSGQERSYHYITDLSIYETSSTLAFERVYGDLADYTILALLPSYLERKDSSLVWMINYFINKSKFRSDCGFYLDDHSELLNKLKILAKEKTRKVLLIGVSYALLDLAEKINFSLGNIVVMETGGMKGTRREIVREELHKILCKKMKILFVHSEYGMTELLSQAYSISNGIFKCPPWVKVLTREVNDPFSFTENGKTGGINIIDLANLNSCSFLATQDVGIHNNDGTFEITGRFDNSDTRGCNLMVI